MKTLKIGTRKSELAMWQANWVKSKLESNGIACELCPIETKGDKVLNVSISKIGSKGVFTMELETMLENGEIDMAVHSAKDLPSKLPKGFSICAYGERKNSEDVLVSNKNVVLGSDPSITIGTSSTRRIAFLKKYYPQISISDMRGNLNTRMTKMEDGICDAMILASAGVRRLGLESTIKLVLPTNQFVPPAGQGSIAVEIFESLSEEEMKLIRKSINHEKSEMEILAERTFLSEMNGGCSIPIFANARNSGGNLTMLAGILSLDGKEFVQKEFMGHDPMRLGKELADYVLENNGQEILEKINNELQNQ